LPRWKIQQAAKRERDRRFFRQWIRITYHLSPQDPRYLALTDPECEHEYWAHHYQTRDHWDDEPLSPEQETETLDTLDSELEDIMAEERGDTPVPVPADPGDFATVEAT